MRIGYFWLFLWLSTAQATSYKTQLDYGRDLYNLLYAYIAADSTHNNADYVKKTLTSRFANEIYAEAWVDGYNHIEVIKNAYHIALCDDIVQPSIIKGIRMYLLEMKHWRMVYFYGWNVFVGLNLFMTVYCLRFFIRYFKFNLPNIDTYYYTKP